MGHFSEDDQVVQSQPYQCRGTWVRPKRFQPKQLTHEDAVDAVLLIYRSGDTEVVCPICGRYEE